MPRKPAKPARREPQWADSSTKDCPKCGETRFATAFPDGGEICQCCIAGTPKRKRASYSGLDPFS